MQGVVPEFSQMELSDIRHAISLVHQNQESDPEVLRAMVEKLYAFYEQRNAADDVEHTTLLEDLFGFLDFLKSNHPKAFDDLCRSNLRMNEYV